MGNTMHVDEKDVTIEKLGADLFNQAVLEGGSRGYGDTLAISQDFYGDGLDAVSHWFDWNY